MPVFTAQWMNRRCLHEEHQQVLIRNGHGKIVLNTKHDYYYQVSELSIELFASAKAKAFPVDACLIDKHELFNPG